MKLIAKKFFSVILVGILAFSLLPVPKTLAVEPATESMSTVEDFGNGITVETTLVIHPSVERSSTKTATLTRDYQKDGSWIATLALTATFSYSASGVSVVSASYTKNLASGWTFNSPNIKKTGGTAILTGDLKKFPFNVPVDMKISCSPTGVITKG